MTTLRTSSAALFLAAVCAAGCGGGGDTGQKCNGDGECAPGEACMMSSCIPRGTGAALWAVEVRPNVESPFASSEAPSLRFGGAPVELRAQALATLPGQVELVEGGGALGADVVASVPSSIPGRPEQQFEAPAGALGGVGNAMFALGVPANLVGRTAILRVLPKPPADRMIPPLSLTAALTPDLLIKVPPPGEMARIDGTLLNAVGVPLEGFRVTATRADRTVSTVGETNAAGKFRVALTDDPAGMGSPIFVELGAAPGGAAQPQLRTFAIPVKKTVDLGDLQMPAYGVALPFRFRVTGPGGKKAEHGATVTFRRELEGAVGGRAVYVREGTTLPDGNLDVLLLPGPASGTWRYDITVVPRAGSDLAVTCTSRDVGPTGGVLPALELAEKASLEGIVRAADGTRASGVKVLASRVPGSAVPGCSGPVTSLDATDVSDKMGYYVLRLDPGLYKVEAEPSTSAAWPRKTESDLVVGVANATASHDITLPDGALVEGVIKGPDGSMAVNAEASFYTVDCAGTDPCDPKRARALLRGKAQSGADGRFRVVLPAE